MAPLHIVLLYLLCAAALTVGVVTLALWLNSRKHENLHSLSRLNAKLHGGNLDATRLKISGFRRVLILGNGADAKAVNPMRLSPDVFTIGINRAYRMFWPHVVMVHDAEVIAEMIKDGVEPPPSTRFVTTTYFFHRTSKMRPSEEKTYVDFFEAHNGVVLPYQKTAHVFTTLQAIAGIEQIVGVPLDRVDMYLAGVTMDPTQNAYFYNQERKANGLEQQFQRFSNLLKERPELVPRLSTVNKDTARLQTLIGYTPVEALYDVPFNVVHVKFSAIAWAPDAIVAVQRRLMGDENAHLVFATTDAQANEQILAALSPRRVNILHYHNRTSSIPLKPNADYVVRSVIQYHSEPEKVQLNAPVDAALVISQYHALLNEYAGMTIVRNIIDYGEAIFRVPTPTPPGSPISIGYSPSTTKVQNKHFDKGFAETMAVLDALKREHPDITVDVMTKVPLEQCMARKARCDILIDECKTGSFHRCTLEALALGKVAVVHINEPLLKLLDDTYGWEDGLPVVNTNLDGLKHALTQLISEGKAKLHARGRANRAWMERCWSDKEIAEEFAAEYRRVSKDV